MSTFNSIKGKISDTAQAAVKASGEIVDISKNKISILTEQNNIKNLKTQIGDLIFEAYKTQRPVDADIKILCVDIQDRENKINTMQTQILAMKKLVACPICKTEVPTNYLFCSNCGNKL